MSEDAYRAARPYTGFDVVELEMQFEQVAAGLLTDTGFY